MPIKTIYRSKLLKVTALIPITFGFSIAETYTDYCKIHNPKNGMEYETHTKITVDLS
jgi:hypothetical protein